MSVINHSYIPLQVSDSTSMRAYAALPEASNGFPVMLVLQEAFGVNHHIREVANRFAGEGYLALAPELFHRTAPEGWEGNYNDFSSVIGHVQALTNEGLEADLRACSDWLHTLRGASSGQTSAIGFCMGGRVAFLANSILPLKAAASFYGGGIAPNPTGPGLLDRTSTLHAPMMLIWGGQDRHIGADQRRAVADALTQAKKSFVHVEFSDADHGFFCDERSSYHPAAARQAWTMVQEFFRPN